MENPEIKVPDAPLYDPIQFVFAGYIGSGKTAEEAAQYRWAHEQIVSPKAGYQLIQYVLFHTPAVYNWLREVRPPEAAELDLYIAGRPCSTPNRPSNKSLLQQISSYASRWEVVRLCFEAEVYIERAACKHLGRRVVWTNSYSYRWKTKQLGLDKFYCRECQSWTGIEKAQVKKCPQIVMLDRLQREVSLQGQIYQLAFALISAPERDILVRIAGGAWYRVSQKGAVLSNIQTAQSVKAEKYFYIRKRPEGKLHLPALASNKAAKPSAMEPQAVKVPAVEQSIKIAPPQKPKPEPSKVQIKRSASVQLTPLTADIYQPATYQNLPQYRQIVQKSYKAQKHKDEYDIAYDRGKVKKVRNKKINKHIDFNELARKVKAGLLGEHHRQHRSHRE